MSYSKNAGMLQVDVHLTAQQIIRIQHCLFFGDIVHVFHAQQLNRANPVLTMQNADTWDQY